MRFNDKFNYSVGTWINDYFEAGLDNYRLDKHHCRSFSSLKNLTKQQFHSSGSHYMQLVISMSMIWVRLVGCFQFFYERMSGFVFHYAIHIL